MKRAAAIMSGYLLCGILTFGILMGDWTRPNRPHGQFNYRDGLGVVVAISCLGPIGLSVALIVTNFCQYGIRYLPPVTPKTANAGEAG